MRSLFFRQTQKWLNNTQLAVVIFFGLPAVTSAESLKEIYELAVKNDHQYQAAVADLKAGKEVTKQGLARLLPNVSASASYSNNERKEQDGTRSTWTFNRSISIQQPLFNMAAWYGYKQVKAIKSRSEANFVQETQSLILRSATAYFDTLEAVDTLATRKAEEKALAHQLEQTKQRFDVGLTAITEVHEAQAAFDSATASRLLAQGNVGIAFEAIEVITGTPAHSLVPLKNDFVADGPQPSQRSAWEKLALKHSVTLQVAKFDEKSRKYNYKVQRSEHLPTVTAGAAFSDQDRGGDGISFDIPGENFSTRVNVNIPIYSGGSVASSSRQAKNEYIAAQERRKRTQRDVLQQARSQHLQVVTSVSTIKARKQAIVSNTSALEATQAGYDVGTRDLVDVLNAQRNLYSAQQNYLDTLYSYILDALELKEIAGQLAPEDIDNLNSWLDQSKSVSSQP